MGTTSKTVESVKFAVNATMGGFEETSNAIGKFFDMHEWRGPLFSGKGKS